MTEVPSIIEFLCWEFFNFRSGPHQRNKTRASRWAGSFWLSQPFVSVLALMELFLVSARAFSGMAWQRMDQCSAHGSGPLPKLTHVKQQTSLARARARVRARASAKGEIILEVKLVGLLPFDLMLQLINKSYENHSLKDKCWMYYIYIYVYRSSRVSDSASQCWKLLHYGA